MATRSDVPAEPIGARLKRLRLERSFSQRDLSSPGVSYAYISRIEAGARTPSVKALRMLAKKLGVSVEYLETGRDVRDVDERELQLADAELALRLGDDAADAERRLEAILDDAVAAGDAEAATRARIALGVSAARRSNHLDAVERLEAAIESQPLPPQARPEVYATLGKSYTALGAPGRAVRLFERCLEEIDAEEPGNTSARIRFAALLSYALSDAGEDARARDVIRKALRSAADGADATTRVRLSWSLARMASLEGRLKEALDHIRQAIVLLKSMDDDTQLGRAYLLSAGVETLEGDAGAARDQLAHASTLLGAHVDPVDAGMLRVGESRLAALESRGDDAVRAAREAFALLGPYNLAEQGSAAWALARGLDLSGDATGAADSYRRAVDLMTLHGRRHEAARAATDWGRMLQRVGREDDAREVLKRVDDLQPDAESRRQH